MKRRISDRLVDWARPLGFWKLLLVTVLACEVFTLAMNTVNSYLWWGVFSADLILIGTIDALVVSLLVAPAVIFVLTRLKAAEAEAAAKSSYLDNILHSSTDMAIAATDMEFRVTLFNPAAEEMLGYRASEVMGRDIRDLHHGEGIDPGRFAAALEAFKRDGEFTFSPAVPHGGGLRFLDVRISGIMDRDGRQAGYALMARDITERRDYEQALKESEEKFRSLVESINDWAWEVDENARYTYASPKVRDILGREPGEIIGMTPFDLMTPGEAERVRQVFGAYAKDRRPFVSLKNINVHKDGRIVVLETSGVPVYDRQGAFRGYRGIDRDITERVKSEDEISKLNEGLELRVAERTEELRKSEARYRMLMEQASDGIGIMAPDGSISTVNRRLCEILGYTEAEVMSLGIEDIFTDDEMPLVAADIVMIHGGETVVRDRTVRRKDGTTLQVELSAKLLDDGSVLAIGRDITARKEAERALRRSEERLRHVVQHMPVMMDAFGEDGTIIVWNRECEKVTGYAAEEIVGRPDALKLLCPDDDYRESMLSEWKRRGNNYRGWEWDMTCKDGSVRTVAWSNKSDVISIPGWATWGIGIDVTEYKRASDELKRSESSYRTMARNLPGIVYRVFVRDGGRMQFFNDMLEPLTGYAAGELCPGSCCSIDPLILPEDRDGVVEQVRRAAAEDRPFIVEYRITHKSGDIRHLQERGRPVRGRDGRPQFIDGVIMDITEFKRAQQEREAIQARLSESQKMEAIGNLAGGIAHDFNNLLTVIQGDNMMLKSEVGETHPASEYIGHIDAAASRASELIKKLMIFSRRERMARAPMDINAAVDDILGVVMRLIGKNISVNTAMGRGVWPVDADVSGIEQVVMNLVLNARDAMPDGGMLAISTENVELDEAACMARDTAGPGRFVMLSVSDTGVGMDEETRRHIFEPFFTTKGRGKGTGLGLSVVYGIVREHGGWIEVTSSPGGGSRFDVYFAAAD